MSAVDLPLIAVLAVALAMAIAPLAAIIWGLVLILRVRVEQRAMRAKLDEVEALLKGLQRGTS